MLAVVTRCPVCVVTSICVIYVVKSPNSLRYSCSKVIACNVRSAVIDVLFWSTLGIKKSSWRS